MSNVDYIMCLALMIISVAASIQLYAASFVVAELERHEAWVEARPPAAKSTAWMDHVVPAMSEHGFRRCFRVSRRLYEATVSRLRFRALTSC
jgi:hypothetical protein